MRERERERSGDVIMVSPFLSEKTTARGNERLRVTVLIKSLKRKTKLYDGYYSFI